MTDPQEIAAEVDWTGADLTLNERIEIEDLHGGRRFEDVRDEGRSTYYRALAWVLCRRTDPRLTLEEAGELHVRFEGGE